ncbi:L,D-transpeptidase [Albidovulum sp.]|jgi:lipoprotein-anchoring transpeptidase ErfK/SrfK|uniref:L,D-transpeptidase n=1 Tax=Albidovulum sp. TaxID=1872424 RepID=UPI003031AD48
MIDRRFLIQAAAAAAAMALARPAAALPAVEPPPPSTPIPGLTLAPELYPTVVTVRRDLVPGSIHVLSSKHYLYYIVRKGVAIRYGVAVGKAELVFRGAAQVGKKVEWPSWKPTPEMIDRNPGAYAKYADGMPGGPKNPLGARAIYLFQDGHDTAIRIHGTIEPNSIGKSVSNGCLRMVNDHVIDLYNRVALGAPVMVY